MRRHPLVELPWGLLGSLLALLGHLGALLGASWAVLERPWSLLGRLGRSEARKGDNVEILQALKEYQ